MMVFKEVSDENGFVSLQNFNSENQKIYVSGIGYEKEEFNLDSIKKKKILATFSQPKISEYCGSSIEKFCKIIFSNHFRIRYSSSSD